MAARPLEKVSADALFVSEPNPSWFGNGPNQPSKQGWTNENWLKSRFHFNFAEHHGGTPNFGVLRVMNDDLVQPARGFGTHPHRDMEICTYIVSGSLTHQDSMGTKESLQRGSIQFMTAGQGVRHSEFNESPDEPLRFIQMWIAPRRLGLPPNYGSMVGTTDCATTDRTNKLAHIVSDVESKHVTAVKINQDANIYVAELEAGKTVDFPVGSGRQAYALAVEGCVSVSESHSDVSTQLEQHAAARLYAQAEATNTITLTAADDKPAHVLIVEMAAVDDGK